jgi:hypothetical protein
VAVVAGNKKILKGVVRVEAPTPGESASRLLHANGGLGEGRGPVTGM